nr:ribonuclease H-like domain-containing protein [Tanacetum cinerariifolium]
MPLDTKSKLGADVDHVSDPTLYRSLVDALHYLTFSHSDISYDVHQHQTTPSHSSAEAEYHETANAIG